MSTCYSTLKSPLTSIQMDSDGIYSRIRLWIRHKLVGELIIDEEDQFETVRLFFDDDDAVVRASGNIILSQALQDATRYMTAPLNISLLSENGTLTTLAELLEEERANKLNVKNN
jgi:hypothetical protein